MTSDIIYAYGEKSNIFVCYDDAVQPFNDWRMYFNPPKNYAQALRSASYRAEKQVLINVLCESLDTHIQTDSEMQSILNTMPNEGRCIEAGLWVCAIS